MFKPQAGGPPLVGCPQLLIQYIRSYPPYLEAVSSIRNLRTRHAMVTSDPPGYFVYNSLGLHNYKRWKCVFQRLEDLNSLVCRHVIGQGPQFEGRSGRRWKMKEKLFRVLFCFCFCPVLFCSALLYSSNRVAANVKLECANIRTARTGNKLVESAVTNRKGKFRLTCT
jgi:hypothetical protein